MKPPLSEIYSLDAENYNANAAKIRSSVTWVVKFSCLKDKQSNLSTNDLFEKNGMLTTAAAEYLISGHPYRQLISYVYNVIPPGDGCDGIIQTLCRYGTYFLKSEDSLVTNEQLEANPIYVDAHLQLIDMLMNAASSKLWASTLNVVASVRRFSSFFASKELPNNNEESIILWLSKVCFKVQHLEETLEIVKKSTNNSRTFPVVTHSLDDICDSCVLAILLHFYCPHLIPLENIALKSLMSIADSLHNLQFSLDFCYTHLYPYCNVMDMGGFLTPEDFIHCSEDMRQNFLSFYAFLFYCFEVEKPKDIVCRRGVTPDRNANVAAVKNVKEDRPISANRTSSRNHLQHGNEFSVSTLLPEVKSLLSEATKKSFLNDSSNKTPRIDAGITNLQTTLSKSTSDLTDKVAHLGLSQAPLLPKRHQEERPFTHGSSRQVIKVSDYPSLRKSTSLDDVTHEIATENSQPSKWKTRVQPFSVYPMTNNDDFSLSIDTSVHGGSYSPHSYIDATSLLSRVEVDDEVDDILSGRVRDSEELSVANSTDLAWSGFTRGKHRTSVDSTPRENMSMDAGDMKLETVRTAEYVNTHRSPLPSGRNRFIARPLTESGDWVGDSSSDLTTVTSVGGGIRSVDSASTLKSNSTSSLGISRKSPGKTTAESHSHNNNSSHPLTTLPPSILKTSYVVEDGCFNTADSARAAGYPVILDLKSSNLGAPGDLAKGGESDLQGLHASSPQRYRKTRTSTLMQSPMRTSASIVSPNKSLGESASKDTTSNLTCWSQLSQRRLLQRNQPNSTTNDVKRSISSELLRRLEMCKIESDAKCEQKDARYIQLLHQYESLKQEAEGIKETNLKLNAEMIQLRQKKFCKGSARRDDISSDYSSKSPSPATSERIIRASEVEPSSKSKLIDDQAQVQRKESDDSNEQSTHSYEGDETVVFANGSLEKPLKYQENQQRTSSKTLTLSQSQNNKSSQMTLNQPTLTDPQNGVDKPGTLNAVAVASNHADHPSYGRLQELIDSHHLSPSPSEEAGVTPKSPVAAASTETGSTRRSLFPSRPIADPKKEALTVPHEVSVSYDSFSCHLKASSCQSTPSKSPPPTTSKQKPDEDTAEQLDTSDGKAALGFMILDDCSPASQLAKKKEQFLLGRLKKEEEQKKKQMGREKQAEQRKMEARLQQERALQKKQEEKEKRDRRFREYQKRKQQEEEAAHHMRTGVIGSNTASGGSGKKTHQSRTNSQQNERVENLRTLHDHDLPSARSALTVPITPKSSGHSVVSGLRDEDSDSIGSGGGSEYTGPKLFKELSSKSNRILISNALNHCCLSGKVNEPVRNKTLRALEQSDARHLMVLFRDNKCQFRALYGYHPDEEKLHKICGNGPGVITPSMIESLFKYNSGRRAFTCVPSKTLSVSIDAITIKNSLWQHKKHPS